MKIYGKHKYLRYREQEKIIKKIEKELNYKEKREIV